MPASLVNMKRKSCTTSRETEFFEGGGRSLFDSEHLREDQPTWHRLLFKFRETGRLTTWWKAKAWLAAALIV